ncbi:MAG: hypothetical protein RMA76_34955 [Deltaproteobacteria bacterium]
MVLDTVLLLALPASGKSEVRKYLAHLSPESAANDFHMGPTVQLDDFPYVHLMRRVDDELMAQGLARIYFEAPDKSFFDRRHWGTLIELLNQDYDDLVAKRQHDVQSAAAWMLERFDRASEVVGADTRTSSIPDAAREKVLAAIEKECRDQLDALVANYPDTLDGKTLVIEFARGGPEGSDLPLPEPHGYKYSLSKLSPALLAKAKVLYIWVTPEESRRKNEARADPDDPGSILHHGVPEYVMRNEYGCDDMDWLEKNARQPGTLPIDRDGTAYDLPIARFDNRVDRTSFVRDDAASWKEEDVRPLHDGLAGALATLANFSG